ncbi:protein of unknown function [Kyrpidia spormannii]|uniref:Uncharacterized protein n=1 Tax=Kyrpidia spormannii TaxID=2055160 RepID=A0ACA8ZDH6_9BACL|nr:protein of unknown function [Kyrpidia spormannii]
MTRLILFLKEEDKARFFQINHDPCEKLAFLAGVLDTPVFIALKMYLSHWNIRHIIGPKDFYIFPIGGL